MDRKGTPIPLKVIVVVEKLILLTKLYKVPTLTPLHDPSFE